MLRIGCGTFLAILVLRLGIGFHFYSEGKAKLRDPKPYSAGFLGSAKGQFAPLFKSMVWDADGLARLDSKSSAAMWDEFREKAGQHYAFDEGQAKKAKALYERRKGQLKWWLDSNKVDIEDYRNALARRNEAYQDTSRMKVASLSRQVSQLESELRASRVELVNPIDLLWAGLEQDMFDLASSQQQLEAGRLSIPKPGRRILDSESIDVLIRYFDVGVGALLIVGLFTRTASILAAAFLLSVVASQWPGSYGSISVWPQCIEIAGLVALAAVGAGRFGGLDFILESIQLWCCPPKQGD